MAKEVRIIDDKYKGDFLQIENDGMYTKISMYSDDDMVHYMCYKKDTLRDLIIELEKHIEFLEEKELK